MLIDYAINYYCRPRLQAFTLLRMYGCGYGIDAVPASTLGPLLTLLLQRASSDCLCICCGCLFWGHLCILHTPHAMRLAAYTAALTDAYEIT